MNKSIYVLTAVLTFLVFMIIMIPASWVVSVAGEDLTGSIPDLQIGALNGTIWNGSGDMQYRDFPPFAVSWQLDALPLLLGTLSTTVQIEADGLQASFQALLSRSGGEIQNAVATIQSSYINQVTVNYGLDLSGTFDLSQASTSFDQQWLTSLDGEINWPGGMVLIETPQQINRVELPPLTGRLKLEEGIILLDVTSRNSDLIAIRIKPDGWAEVAISYAFMALANIPVPGAANGSLRVEPAVLLEEKIL